MHSNNTHYSLQEVIRISFNFLKRYFILIGISGIVFFSVAFLYLKNKPELFETRISAYSLVIDSKDLDQHLNNFNDLLRQKRWMVIEENFSVNSKVASKIEEISLEIDSRKSDNGSLSPNHPTNLIFSIQHQHFDDIDSLLSEIERFVTNLPDLKRKQEVLIDRIRSIQNTLEALEDTEVDFSENANKLAYSLSKVSASEATYTLLTLINTKELEAYSDILYVRNPIIQGDKDVSYRTLKYLVSIAIGLLIGIVSSFIIDSLKN